MSREPAFYNLAAWVNPGSLLLEGNRVVLDPKFDPIVCHSFEGLDANDTKALVVRD